MSPDTLAASFPLASLPDWIEGAACAGVDPDIFFSHDDLDRRAALELCGRCPVRQPCLELALRTGETHGIWGGADEQERKRLLRRRRAA